MLNDVPAYSEDALAAIDVFLFEFNDCLFYVEDVGQENLYLSILGKIMPDVKIDNIFPLGGKENVLTHCRENPASRRPAFYILDMDYDDLLGEVVEDERIIYLKRYSIENYFIEFDAILNLIISEYPKRHINDVRENLRFDDFYRKTLNDIRSLVRAFILTQLHKVGAKGCGLAIERFVGCSRYIIDANKVALYEAGLFLTLKTSGVYSDIDEMRRAGDRHISFDLEDVGRRACGKHLLALLAHWLSDVWGVKNITSDSFCYRLASACGFESLLFISEHVKRVMRGTAVAA
ncbi:Protein of unknown function [Burkholderia orbicola]|uniref:DUF4435 domain-containing protein n=1 Tax=Burkholderia orbicola TaxID=2978683 RepID=UPI00088A5840|nr:Protein of unknown function [Burkholderia orbicola]